MDTHLDEEPRLIQTGEIPVDAVEVTLVDAHIRMEFVICMPIDYYFRLLASYKLNGSDILVVLMQDFTVNEEQHRVWRTKSGRLLTTEEQYHEFIASTAQSTNRVSTKRVINEESRVRINSHGVPASTHHIRTAEAEGLSSDSI